MAMPLYVTFLGIFSLSSFGFPGTNNFVSEFLVLIAAFAGNPWLGAVSIVGVVLSAAYMLRLLQKMVWDRSDGHGHHNGEGEGHDLWDLGPREAVTLLFPALFVIWLGFYPKPLLNVMDKSVAHLVQQVERGREVSNVFVNSGTRALNASKTEQ
jgi:NADH-quinone oxidoreductase subunit M